MEENKDLDLEKIGLFDIWYPKLSELTVQQFFQSTIAKRDDTSIYDSITALPFPS